MRRVEDLYVTVSFDLLHLSETDHNLLVVFLMERLNQGVFLTPCKDEFETETSRASLTRFSLQQEVFFYKPHKGKAYVWGEQINKGTEGEIVNIIGKLKLIQNRVHLQLLNERLGKKFYNVGGAEQHEKLKIQVTLANRLGYLGRVKGPYIFPAAYGKYNRALIVMRKLPGQSLEGFIKFDEDSPFQNNAHPLTLWERLRLLAVSFRATTFLHQANIVHRDFSPKNLQVTLKRYYRALWLDLGLARDAKLDDTVRTTGTPIYWSAQAALGHLQTQADDLFAGGLIAGEILCADLSHVTEFMQIASQHANYQFYNLFKFISKEALTPAEQTALTQMLENIVTNNSAARLQPALCLKVVEPIQLAVLQRLHPNCDELYKAFALGQLTRDLMDAEKLFDWLDFPKMILALNRLEGHLDEVADTESALQIFLEKAECGVLLQFNNKVDMKNQIHLWRCTLKVNEIEWHELKDACTLAFSFATEQTKSLLAKVQARLTQLEDRYKVQVHWDELPFILDELQNHIWRLSKQLLQAYAPVSQMGQFSVSSSSLALIEKSSQKRIKY